jgi:hypothetical protein
LVRALPPAERQALITRVGARIDPAMRIDAAVQLARAIVNLPEARDSELLQAESRAAVRAVASAGGTLLVAEVPSAARDLVDRGMLFEAKCAQGAKLWLPTALLLQLRPWESEDPCSARVLLWHTGDEAKLAIASYYLGRPATRPLSLSLQPAFVALTDPARIAEELQRLSPTERRVLTQVEEQGGEVDTAELLDLEREPLRLRNGTGQSLARRGVSYSLERRGFLIPLHPNRHVIPREVAVLVGAGRHEQRAAQRSAILQFVLAEDHAPRRARFAKNAAPLTFALAILRSLELGGSDADSRDAGPRESGLRESGVVPRTVLSRWATRLGHDVDRVTLLAALSRAAGLWDVAALQAASQRPLRDCTGEEMTSLLFDAWYRGGAWNEAHPGGEVARAGRGDAGALHPLRTLVLEALLELGQGRWVPWEALAGYVRTDARAAGLSRLLNRWAARAGVEPQPIAEIARRMTVESLHALGIVDLGVVDLGASDVIAGDLSLGDGILHGGALGDAAGDDDGDVELGTTLRVTPRGLVLLKQVLGRHATTLAESGAVSPSAVSPSTVSPSAMVDDTVLRVGEDARLSQVLAVAAFAELQAVTPALELRLTSARIGEALARGLETSQMLQALSQLTQPPEATVAMLQNAGVVRGAIEHVACAGFLRIEQRELRDLLLSRRQTMDLFLPGSPEGGLLIAPAVDFEQLVRRCRVVGVELTSDGQVWRTGSTRPPPARSGAAPAPQQRRSRSKRPASGPTVPARLRARRA